jgi:hypothetical protein
MDEETVETIRSRCDNHPYLLQLVSKRYLELSDLDDAIEQVATDPMVSYFFSVDFEMLSEAEQGVVRIIAESTAANSNSIQGQLDLGGDAMSGLLHRLEHLGYLRRNADKRFELVNYFFRRWFSEQKEAEVASPAAIASVGGDESLSQELTMLSVPEFELFDERYEIQRELGRGAMGVVYAARDRMLEETIAIKSLKAEYSKNRETLERFRR